MWAVETKGLTKTYGPVQSLVNCNLQIPVGCVFGLLGPNGAGKTTLIRTLLGFIEPTSGTAEIAGCDIRFRNLTARKNVSYLPGDARLNRSMRGRDLIAMFSGLHPHGSLAASRAVAERLDLDLSRRVMFMSTGMRQKLAISIVLGCQAPLIVLDEPTANLDPNVRAEVMELVKEARAAERTVLLSSHIFSDIDDTCDQVVIMRSGKIVAQQDMRQLEELHIVTAQLTPDSIVDKLSDDGSQAEFVLYQRTSQIDDSDELPRAIELHLTGSPNHWLHWLEAKCLEKIRIERAGIRAVYQRHHRASDQSNA